VQGNPVSLRLRTTLVNFSQMRTKDNVFVSIDLGMFSFSFACCSDAQPFSGR
jgi:hypothetical protein